MAGGVFGAAGYRASLENGDEDEGHSFGHPHTDRGQNFAAGDSGVDDSGSDDFDADDSANGTDLEQADRMVEESGIVYGAELIPREVTGAAGRSTEHSDGSSSSGADGQSDHLIGRHSVNHLGTHSSGAWPVGRVGASELYVTPELTFDLAPAQPHISPADRHRLDQNEPAKIRHLLGMYRFTRPSERPEAFVRQAEYMADYEPQGTFDASFHAFYPVYSDMTVRQLKGYFAWRTRVRSGEYPLTSTSAVFVYVYELLNGVGAKDPVDTYNRLEQFRMHYARRYDAGMNSYLRRWMRDLVVVSGLDGAPLQEQFGTEIAADRAFAVLTKPQNFTDAQIAQAAKSLGSYKAAKSPLNRPAGVGAASEFDADDALPSADVSSTPPTLYDRAVAAAWKAVVSSHVTAKSYIHARLAVWKMTPVTLFQRAVYYDRDLADHPYETRRVTIDPVREYTRENGHWYLGCYEAVPGQRAYMNDFLHEVDRIGRGMWHTGRPLKPRGFNPLYTQVIARALADLKKQLDRQEWEAAHPPVHVDLGQLSAIRQAAAGTRESLLTQEERDAERAEAEAEAEAEKRAREAAKAEPETQSRTQIASQTCAAATAVAASVPDTAHHATTDAVQNAGRTVGESGHSSGAIVLTPDELFLLRALADGEPSGEWKPALLKKHVLPSVLADSINSKLFDLVGDSVLETDENGDPSLVEDYRPDIRDFLAGNAGN